ncbi:unnamed protein product, partial [Brassica oleracea var. botrytis]
SCTSLSLRTEASTTSSLSDCFSLRLLFPSCNSTKSTLLSFDRWWKRLSLHPECLSPSSKSALRHGIDGSPVKFGATGLVCCPTLLEHTRK